MRIAAGVAMGSAWYAAARLAGPMYVAEPMSVLYRILDLAASGDLPRHLFATLRLSALGFAAGSVLGLALPLVLHGLPRLRAAVEPYVTASAGIPKYALMPLFILWFGIDDAPKLWLVGLLVFYPVFIGISSGIGNVDAALVTAAQVLGGSRAMIVREVVCPSVLPYFNAALQIALPRAISAAIMGEFLIGDEGLGYLIESARQRLDTTGVFAGLAVSTALVVCLSGVVLRYSPRLNPLHGREARLSLPL
jgi:NitT/TauT family transport system permease protein